MSSHPSPTPLEHPLPSLSGSTRLPFTSLKALFDEKNNIT
jgi:hypothetical protein